MAKVDEYREILKNLDDWDKYLIDESGLPGPRANLELAEAVAEEGDLDRFRRYLGYGPEEAPYGSSLEFLPVCGVIGLGRVMTEGRLEMLEELRIYASDPRWRIREGVAIALQRFGGKDMGRLLKEMEKWSHGNLLERRAAVAALCEPRLLKKSEYAQKVLDLLDQITKDILLEDKRKTDEFIALRKGLGYCWSVAAAAAPEAGKKLMEKWLASKDKDIRWIMKENLKKNRLKKMDPEWTQRWQTNSSEKDCKSEQKISEGREMGFHEEKVSRISKQLKERKSTAHLSLKKKAVSHQVPKPQDKKHSDEKLDISDFDEIIHIDTERRICIAEPGVTFTKLVDATLRHGLVPVVVPELKTITIGGAVAGCSIESMSYKFGGFHDNCLEYEVVTAKGDVLICTPDNENKLLFQMVHGTFGTLGIITLLKFRLIPAKPFVKVTYEKYKSLEEYKDAIWAHYKSKDIDFMDGIIHSPVEYVLSAGNFVDKAPYTHNYDWMRIYFLSTAKLKEDYLKTPDYFFRYNKGVTNVHPKSFIGRLLFGRLINSNSTLKTVNTFRKFIPSTSIPITVDTFIPFSKMEEFMEWYKKEVNHFPLWCVPYKIVHKYEWLSDEFLSKINDELFLDIALYGMRRKDAEHYYRIIEKKLIELGAIKTFISTNLYSEEEFWKICNEKNYDLVKRKTDPDNIFRGFYEKTCSHR